MTERLLNHIDAGISMKNAKKVLNPVLPCPTPDYNRPMPKASRYTPEHAKAGLDHTFPETDTWPN